MVTVIFFYNPWNKEISNYIFILSPLKKSGNIVDKYSFDLEERDTRKFSDIFPFWIDFYSEWKKIQLWAF